MVYAIIKVKLSNQFNFYFIFYIAQEDSIELFKYQFEDDIDKNDINLVNEYLLEEISKINVDKIKSYGDVEYYFKRNR